MIIHKSHSKKSLIELFDDYPVLWVSGYEDITEDLLKLNNHLYEEAQDMNLNPLDLNNFFERMIQ